MLRGLFISILILTLGYLFLKGGFSNPNDVKPLFLRSDEIALNHQTRIELVNHSHFQPTEYQLELLEKNYSAIWAHLNHLYSSNDIEAGKEYYTEKWFRQINQHYIGQVHTKAERSDEQHELHIQNWSMDGLVCTAIDNNVVLNYRYRDQSQRSTRVQLAVVLLFQGDNWRIDALKVLDEKNLLP